jgi:hypothetical protein
MGIDKNTLNTIVSFINSNFGGFAEEQRDKALTSLKALFERHNLTLVPDGTIAKAKGAKSVAHNTDEDKYIRVENKSVKCPTLIKAVQAKNPSRLLCWITVPDSNRTVGEAELESFASYYLPSVIKKHDDFTAARNAWAARQCGEDIRNNQAQKAVRIEGKEEDLQKFSAPFIALPESIWLTVRPSLQSSNADALSYIEEKRSELQS